MTISPDLGAGTANAIVATTEIPVSESALILLNVFEANTGAATVAFNGGSALTIKTASGNDVVSGGLVAGMALLGKITGSTFRMVSDQASAAIQAAAEAAALAAEAALAAIDLPPIAANTMLVDNAGGTDRETKTFPEVKTLLNLTNTTRAFATAAALLLAVVAEDHISIADVPMVSDASGTFLDSAGKKFKPAFWVTPKLYGAAGDGTTDDVMALRACWDAAGLYRVPVLMQGLEYNCSDSVFTSSNLTVHGQGAVMYVTDWPSVGGLINNVRPVEAERAQSNIRFYDLITDGSKLPTPTAGQNCNLGPEFARGVSDVIVEGCTARYIREGSGGGTGGGGFGGEVGLRDVHFTNCIAHDCYRGYRVAGKTGVNVSDGSSRWCVNVTFKDCAAIRCGAATFAHSVGDPDSLDDSDLSRFDVLFDGFYAEDCGHQGWFDFDFETYPTVDEQKSGVFVFGGAQNIRMRGVRVKINGTYPAAFTDFWGRTGYPAGGTGLMGSGLSGFVGALFWGHGRNIVVEDCTLDGSVDAYWKCARAQAMGDLASVPPTGSNVAQNIFNVRHVRPGAYGVVFDGGDVGVNLMAAISSSIIRVTPNSNPTVGVVGSDGTVSQPIVRIEFISNDGKLQAGTSDEWKARGNTRPTSAEAVHYLGGVDFGNKYSATGATKGITIGTDQAIRWSTTGTAVGTFAAFYNANGIGGYIQLSGPTTTYATTSDETLKDFIGEYDWQEAFRIIKADPVRDFTWKTSGEYAVGWGAQTSYALQPDLAAKGGWFDADWQPCEEGTEGATYMPWGVDMGKRTPYLWAAVSRLIEEVDDLRAKLGVTYH